jgi:Na+-transporting methylmalonyl-CoA/oxaloacetate decarboxylase gamma subunit
MSDMQFGLFSAAAGMGITLVVLYSLGWIIRLLIKLFPRTEEEDKETKSS